MSDSGWDKVRKLFALMSQFRACLHVCSAPASRWGLGAGFDTTSERLRSLASDVGINTWTGAWLWDVMAQFTSPKSRQHHGERSGPDFACTGSCTATSWHWDRV
eukprot:6901910-Heterocapsa_arctica.AAC.1